MTKINTTLWEPYFWKIPLANFILCEGTILIQLRDFRNFYSYQTMKTLWKSTHFTLLVLHTIFYCTNQDEYLFYLRFFFNLDIGASNTLSSAVYWQLIHVGSLDNEVWLKKELYSCFEPPNSRLLYICSLII